VDALRAGECCVCDLASAIDVRQSLLSFHLRTLKEAGVLSDRRDGRWVHYSLNASALAELEGYVSRLGKSARGATHRLCCRHGRG
jgi:ArsR family transcriptional regulator